MPFLDGSRSFDEVDDDWLEINGRFAANSTNGIAHLVERSRCSHCDDLVAQLCNVGGEDWCESCRDGDAFCSDYSDEDFSCADQCEVVVRRDEDGNVVACWAECERDEYATLCEATQDYYQTSRFEFVERSNGETWVAWYAEEHPEEGALTPAAAAPDADNDNSALGERNAA